MKKIFKARYEGREVPTFYLYEVTSSYLEGRNNELEEFGYNRDGKKGKKQVIFNQKLHTIIIIQNSGTSV